MRKKITICVACALLVFGQSGQAAPNGNSAELEDIIQKGDFSTAIPSEVTLIKRYGKGGAVIKDGVLYRTYYSKTQHLWIRLAASTDPAPSERAVSEIMVSSIRPAKQAGAIALQHDVSQLRGVKIGDSISSLSKTQDAPETLTQELGGEKIMAQRFRPDPKDPNFYIDYYVKLDKIVAFAIGLDE